MALLPPHENRTPPRRAGVLMLLAAGLAAATAGTAAAQQQQTQLRGAVAEADITDGLLGASSRRGEIETDLQPGRYSPITQSAATDQPGSMLDDPLERPRTRQDIFADDILSRPATPQARATAPARAGAEADVDADLATGAVRAGTLDALDEERNQREAGEGGPERAFGARDRIPEDDAYAPLGIRAGTFIVRPTLEQGIGWTSNATSSPGGRASTYSETGLRLDAISDWSRHTARLRADGTYRKSVSGEEIDELQGGIDGELRLDLGHDLSALAALGYRVRPESASSPVDLGDVASQPLRHSFTAATGIARDIGRLRLDLTGDLERTIHDDAELSGGGTASQKDRDYTLATVKLRGGYEISPALRPFAEVEFGRRIHDNKLDAGGYERSADRYGLRAGVELDMGEKLAGEVSAGWLSERPDDERLDAIEGLALAAALAWSPVRGTTVELNGTTEIEGATDAGASGSMLYSGNLAVSRQLRANLTGRALAGIDWRDYTGGGSDLVMRGEVSLTWWMNRYAGLTGRLRHERQESTLPDRDYDATSVFLGMTLQR